MLSEGTTSFCSSDTEQLDFLQAMHMFSKWDAPTVAQAFDLTEFESACDLGGEISFCLHNYTNFNDYMIVLIVFKKTGKILLAILNKILLRLH